MSHEAEPRAAFDRLVTVEQELAALLQRRLEQDRAMLAQVGQADAHASR